MVGVPHEYDGPDLQLMAYQDDACGHFAMHVNPDVYALWASFETQYSGSPAAPYDQMYTHLEALQAVDGWSDAVQAPAGLQPRTLLVSLGDQLIGPTAGDGLGSVNMVVPNILSYQGILASTNFPAAAASLSQGDVLLTFKQMHGESKS